MKRLVYLTIFPEVEVELVHILAHPFWNRPYSCRTADSSQCGYFYPWLLIPAFVTCSTNVKGWKPETKYCCQASYGNVHSLCSLVEKCATFVWWISITIVQSYTRNISSVTFGIVTCAAHLWQYHGNKLVIFSGVALYYGDTYTRGMNDIVGQAWASVCAERGAVACVIRM